MKRLLLLILLAACGSPDKPGRRPPADSSAPPPSAPSAPDRAADMPLTLRAKFVPVETDVLHAASPASLDDEGPFIGNELGVEDYDFLDEQLMAMVGYEELHACIELEDGLFVLRGPGVEMPTDLFLAQWEPGPRILTWIADLAFAHCGDDGCSVQQSWLTDLDGDGRRDVVRRSRVDDLETGQSDESLEAWHLSSTGALTPATLTPSDRARYRME